ncbi:rab11 family-interacting protein hypothetical protein [Limosa lapponica baueri]|uniref:Rab11-FIP3/4 domain-containing protein n=1 Tax=Limosa lapponica baueri TaxID=1758121 RepID=A0A2I0T3E1_LIMLA|nr:rab11 family-interacting protein hypothetical protein [Limosa lapponica baueri]
MLRPANALEEQLKEQELRADQTLLEEIKKQRELLSKMEREKSIEIENLQASLNLAQFVNEEVEKQKLLDEIEDLTVQLTEEQEKKRKMGDKLSQERHQFQKEKESTQEPSVSASADPAGLCPPSPFPRGPFLFCLEGAVAEAR